MIARTRKTNTRSSQDALAAFVQKKAEIDAMLSRLQSLSDDHFNYSPDEIDWGHVGTLGYYAELLKRHRQRLQRGRACRVAPPPVRSSAA
jgi:hypothetical protein